MKQKRYWLRGGIILAVITFILIITRLIDNDIIAIPFLPAVLAVWGLGGGDAITQSTEVFLTYLILLPYGFIIGAAIGWIYGEIKNRKKNLN